MRRIASAAAQLTEAGSDGKQQDHPDLEHRGAVSSGVDAERITAN
jgi:hypothetical protein